MVNAHGQREPSRLVSRGERSFESKAPRRNGPRRSASPAGPGSSLSAARRGRAQAGDSVANHRSASVQVVRTRRAPAAASGRQVVGGQRPPSGTVRSPAPVAGAEPGLAGPAAGAGRGEFDVQPAVGGEQLAAAAQQPARVAADADVAVGEQQVPPAAVPGQRGEDVAAQRGRAAGAGQPDGRRADVDAERRVAEPVQGAGEPARSAADVERRPGAAVEQRGVAGQVVAAPGGGVDAVLGAAVVAHGQARRATRRRRGRRAASKTASGVAATWSAT